MSQLRLVLFDLDGTLADTAGDIARATNVVLEEAGRPPLTTTAVRALVSSGARAILRAGFETPPDEAEMERMVARLFDHYAVKPAADTRAFPGMPELIGAVAGQGAIWGVVTNKPARLAIPVVSALNLAPAAVCVIGGDSLAQRKPDPLPLVVACERAGVVPSEAIYIGDAEIDVRAAHGAGMEIAIAGFGYAPPVSEALRWGADFYFARVDELAHALLERLPAPDRA